MIETRISVWKERYVHLFFDPLLPFSAPSLGESRGPPKHLSRSLSLFSSREKAFRSKHLHGEGFACNTCTVRMCVQVPPQTERGDCGEVQRSLGLLRWWPPPLPPPGCGGGELLSACDFWAERSRREEEEESLVPPSDTFAISPSLRMRWYCPAAVIYNTNEPNR